MIPPPSPLTEPVRRYPSQKRKPTNRYGLAPITIFNHLFDEKYKHHISAFASTPTPPITKDSKLPTLSKVLKGSDGSIWRQSTANEFGRLISIGVGRSQPVAERIESTATIEPILKSAIPAGRKVTYANFIYDIRPQKVESHRDVPDFWWRSTRFP